MMIHDVNAKRLGCLALGFAAFAAAAWGWSDALPALVAARIFGF